MNNTIIVFHKTVNFNPIKNYDAVVLYYVLFVTNGWQKLFFFKERMNGNFDFNPVCKMTVDSNCRRADYS